MRGGKILAWNLDCANKTIKFQLNKFAFFLCIYFGFPINISNPFFLILPLTWSGCHHRPSLHDEETLLLSFPSPPNHCHSNEIQFSLFCGLQTFLSLILNGLNLQKVGRFLQQNLTWHFQSNCFLFKNPGLATSVMIVVV